MVPVVPIEKDEQQEEEDHGAADGKQNLHLESTWKRLKRREYFFFLNVSLEVFKKRATILQYWD